MKNKKAQLLRMGISGKGELSLAWSGGKYKTSSGYVLSHRPEHPNTNSRGYVREHRLVCEQVLGRYLSKEEQVHHINGVKNDNRPQNLKVMSIHDHLSFENVGEKNHFFGKQHTSESREKIREARKKQVGINHPMFGKHHSEETKRKISETKKRRATWQCASQ